MNRETPIPPRPDAPEIGLGLIGYQFMGKAHSHALKTLPYMIYPPPAIPRLAAICGRREEGVRAAAHRYGYDRYYTDWRALVADEAVQVLDNGASNNLHAAPCIAAAQAGKHVLCEKPLARNAAEAREMLDAVQKAGVKHMVAFNYRFVPALRLARDLIAQGALGRLYHYRAAYLQDWVMPHYHTPRLWKLDRETAGSGVVGDIGSHIIDLGRFLVGEIKGVMALTRTFVLERPSLEGDEMVPVDVDDAFAAAVEFENGAIGTLEGTRFAGGHKNFQTIEVNGEKGTIRFNLERLNELQVYFADEPPRTEGFRTLLVTEDVHPWITHWWPPGHIIGWEHTFVHELAHFLDCIVHDTEVAPYGATFADGFRAAVVCDALLESARTRRQVDIRYA